MPAASIPRSASPSWWAAAARGIGSRRWPARPGSAAATGAGHRPVRTASRAGRSARSGPRRVRRLDWRCAPEPAAGSLDVLDLLAHLLDQDLHLDRDAGQLQGSGLAAQGVGLPVQLLDQEIQALAHLATGLEQTGDLVEVGDQAAEFLGHVDPDGEGRGLAQGALAGRLGADLGAGAGAVQGLGPALEKAFLLTADHRGDQRRGLGGQCAQAGDALQQDVDQALAFAGAGVLQRLDGLAPGLHGQFVPGGAGRGRATPAAPLHDLVDRQRRRLGQPAGHLGLDAGQAAELFGAGLGQGVVGDAAHAATDLDLAAAQRGGQRLAQRGLGAPQFVGQAEAEVQETAVDRAKLDADARGRAGALWSGAGRGAGEPGHAVDWHGACWQEAKTRLCQSPNPPRCLPAPWLAATRSSRNWRPAALAWCTWPKTSSAGWWPSRSTCRPRWPSAPPAS